MQKKKPRKSKKKKKNYFLSRFLDLSTASGRKKKTRMIRFLSTVFHWTMVAVFVVLIYQVFVEDITLGNINFENKTASASLYKKKLKEIEKQEIKLRKDYAKAGDWRARKKVIKAGEKHLFTAINDELFSFWYGTPWDYNGTTQIPNTGKIACGYFVSTILRDAGFNVDRVSLARQTSENIVKSLTPSNEIKRFRRSTIKYFVETVVGMGDGVYVVGLDTHVGFMIVKNKKARFVHASKTYVNGVKSENPFKSKTLIRSKYKVVGKVFNEKLMQTWLEDRRIPTKTL